MATTPAHPVARHVRRLAAAYLAGLPDPQLLERFARRGDEGAFAALVGRHGALVLGACRRVLGDWHAAQDCFQATFLVLAKKAGALKRPEALGPWLYGVACRTARKARSREARRRACERQAARTPAVGHPDDLVWRDLRPVLDEAVARLPDKYRVPFVLHHLQGATVAEVARRLGCPQGTVAAHLARARERLRLRLGRRGVVLSGGALAAALCGNAAPACPPAALAARVVEAAGQVAAGNAAAAGAIPAGASALTKGALRVMGKKLRIALGLLAAVVAGVGGGWVSDTGTAPAAPEPPPRQEARAGTPERARPLSLADLQRLALSNSPLIRQAAADVEAARGAAIQVGAAPAVADEPTADAGTAVGKRSLSRAAALLDLRLAQLALRRAQADLRAAVRSGYFAVLAAREDLRVARDLARAAEDVLREEGTHAGALQARLALTQARQCDAPAWKQLAATLGLPGLPPADLAGRLDGPLPTLRYEEALARVLGGHTDVLAAESRAERARVELQRARIAPVPDAGLRAAVPKDVAAPDPMWDRDKGSLLEAEAALLRATEEVGRVRTELTSRLAAAFERYEDSRRQVEWARTEVTPDRDRAWRRVCQDRRRGSGRVSAGDLLAVRQAFAAATLAYHKALRARWSAVAEVTALLQTEEPPEGGAEGPTTPDRVRGER
jgi:RNA polymerase sigma factor (sigma-70 family)